MTKEEFEEWQRVVPFLAQAKAREMELRKMIAQDLGELPTGTSEAELFGSKLKIAITDRLTLDAEKFDELAVNMDADEVDCIVHKPSIDKKKYDKLPANNALALNCVTRKQSTPTIKEI